MHVDYRRSGGLAGIAMTARVDARELPVELAQVVTRLMGDDSTRAPASRPAGGADQFSYDVTLDDGGRTRTLHWEEPEVPDDVRPLLTNLASRAHPAPPS